MKPSFEEIQLVGETFLLLPQRALFRPGKEQLIVSDIHLGKASHFRKQGIAFPPQSHLKDLDKLHYLLNTWKPSSVLILGDLFHSSYNKEWLWFKSLLMHFSQINFILVEGNHDILDKTFYAISNLLVTDVLEEEHLIFSHKQLNELTKLNIHGHIHPGVEIFGMARQSIRLPCYYLARRQFIMPAFGHLTGLHVLKREDDTVVYAILENSIVKLNGR
ncbi:MAG: putative phosphoesterase [Bacteroidota bacterium]|nr:putative phosphoesterase [Bacteroidota bacterium]